MNNVKEELTLHFSDEAFEPVINDADAALQRLIANMVKKNSEAGTLTIKIDIELARTAVENFDPAIREEERIVLIPKLTHKVSSVMQIKDETKGGKMYDGYELVWDEEHGEYVMRPYATAQQTIFDADYRVVNDEEGESKPDDSAGSTVPLITGHVEDHSASHPVKVTKDPFKYLCQFIGDQMRVFEALGNYTVRAKTDGTTFGTVVLSSAYEPTNRFFCSAEKLKPHIGHEVVCVGYDLNGNDVYQADNSDDLASISIVCTDCREVLFAMDASENASPEDEEAEDAQNGSTGETPSAEKPEDGEPEDMSDAFGGYPYERPVQ